ncbi:hypothetical protein Tco_0639091 [Tanacetum coccineum]
MSAGEKNAYNERLSTLQTRQFGIPRLVDWNVFKEYGCEDALMDMMKIEYMNEDGYLFLDRSWENVFSNGEKFYREWLMTNDKGFNYDAYWNRIRQPTTGKKLADIRYPWLHIMHKILVGAFMHRSGSRDKVQKPDLWLLSLLDEGNNANVAWILAEELAKCLEPVKSESWDDKMFRKALDRRAKKLSPITPLKAPTQASNLLGGEPSGLNSSWGD